MTRTAISLPDEVFEEAERLARKAGVTRSALYRRALEDFIARYDAGGVRDAIDAATKRIGETERDFVNAAAGKILEKSEW